MKDGVTHGQPGFREAGITHCPLAGYWMRKGSGALRRLYWLEDRAKDTVRAQRLSIQRRNALTGGGDCSLELTKEKACLP